MTKHILSDQTVIELLPTEQVIISQGPNNFVEFTREKAIEALLFVIEHGRKKLPVPPKIHLSIRPE